MKVINPTHKAAPALKLRETQSEYRVRVRRPLRGAGVVTKRRVLVGKTLRPKTRLTAGIFQRKGRGPMKMQALAFPKPTTAASARRKARKITVRKVNPCRAPGGYKEAPESLDVVHSNPDRSLSRVEAFHFRLVRELENFAELDRSTRYRAGLVNALLAVDAAIAGAYPRESETSNAGRAIGKTWHDFARRWKLSTFD